MAAELANTQIAPPSQPAITLSEPLAGFRLRKVFGISASPET
jgi:hypothetical protein